MPEVRRTKDGVTTETKLKGGADEAPPINYFEHPFIKADSIETRLYQKNIAAKARNISTLAVLPTGLGKTVIALMLVADHVENGKILFMAPTKPLVEQHFNFLQDVLMVDEIVCFTGEVPPRKREELWAENRVIISTPQVIENDVLSKRIDLQDVALVVFDEAHRAVGDYAYVYIGQEYLQARGEEGKVLGITASPGSDSKRIGAVCNHLGISHVEIRTEYDPDVIPYVHDINLRWVKVRVPPEIQSISQHLKGLLDHYIIKLSKFGLVSTKRRVSTRELLEVQRRIQARLREGEGSGNLYYAASVQAAAIKVNHAIELVETQGIDALRNYLERLEGEGRTKASSKATKMVVASPSFKKVMELSQGKFSETPKLRAVGQIVSNQLRQKPDSKVIVFTHYRDTAEMVTEFLNGKDGLDASRFVGQASRGSDKGLSQKEQIGMIQDFRDGEFNVLVATSVAEEGLDIPSTDLVVFYEPVPSEIRTIQRRGRTGRKRMGEVVILISAGTRDEAYYWTAMNKEKKMKRQLERIRMEMKKVLPGFSAPLLNSKGAPMDANPDASNWDWEQGGSDPNTMTLYDAENKEPKVDADVNDGEPNDTERPPNTTKMVSETSTSEELPNSEASASSEQDEKADDTVRVIADTREFRSPVVKLISKRNVLVESRQLAAGDYVISDRLAIERKAGTDLVDSLFDGRLFQQMKTLKSAYMNPVLIIEGKEWRTARYVRPEAVDGAVATILIDFRIPIINTTGPEETADMIAAMARREAEEGRVPSVRSGKPQMSPKEQQQFIVEGLPGISGKMAQRLLDHFGSVSGIMGASKEQLTEVKGVGPKTADAIIDIINRTWL